jgi:hypothetical protein
MPALKLHGMRLRTCRILPSTDLPISPVGDLLLVIGDKNQARNAAGVCAGPSKPERDSKWKCPPGGGPLASLDPA